MTSHISCHALLAAALLALALSSCSDHKTPDDNPVLDNEWYQAGNEALQRRLDVTTTEKPAKNVILFIGDGMGLTTISAARIFAGQSKGMEGEENLLAFENFPHIALVKTYAANAQIPDSAATASAINTGIKTNNDVISVPASVPVGDCSAQLNNPVPKSIAQYAEEAGRSTGVITTTVIQDATPSAVYAHSAARDWISDQHISDQAREAGCIDISVQLAESGLEVAMGGGRAVVFTEDVPDPEAGRGGLRLDGRNLVAEWMANFTSPAYVTSAEELAALDLDSVDSLMGLYAFGSMVFEEEDGSDGSSNPTLAEMTAAAINVLSRNPNGYFLMVEHEGSDDMQHAGFLRKTFEAIQEISDAVAQAAKMSDLSETLIVVTADHGQGLVFAGPSVVKGNPILGLANSQDEEGHISAETGLAGDGKPYTTLGFYGGPNAVSGGREDLTGVDTMSSEFIPQAAVLLEAVPHSGEDVPLYAIGPRAQIFGGVIEQNAIHHFILHALGLKE